MSESRNRHDQLPAKNRRRKEDRKGPVPARRRKEDRNSLLSVKRRKEDKKSPLPGKRRKEGSKAALPGKRRKEDRSIPVTEMSMKEEIKAFGQEKHRKEERNAPSQEKERNKGSGSKLKIIPLGGLEQIGLNITVFEYENTIIVVDCGLSFPADDMLGVDLVIPDVTYLIDNIDRVKGFVITHGHEDHIGALPYILKKVNVPVYATRLTMGLIERKLEEHELLQTTRRKVIKFGQSVTLGAFRVEFIKTNHSIVDAAALAIYSPAGIVVHTGDFKVDYTPVYGDAIDLQRFAAIGNKGVLALMCDSTNAERPGFTPSEKTVGKTIFSLFEEHKDSRIIVATFASNVDRVQQIINTAYRFGRKVVVEGRSMVNIMETAQKLSCITIPPNTIIEENMLNNYRPEQTVIITTGSQGESMAALSRMAENMHRKISITPHDTIIFSSHPIPGNEKAVTNVINELLKKGAEVIFQDVHVSGHACQEEIKLLYTLVRPKYAIPVHGEYKHLKAQARIAKDLGYDSDRIFILESGDVLELDRKSAVVRGKVETGAILVDGKGVGDVGNVVLRDRQKLADDGIIICTLALDQYSNELISGPEIVSRGFVYEKEADVLLEGARAAARDAVNGCLAKGQTDWNRMRTIIRDAISGYVWEQTERKPMILPMIMDVP